MRPAKVVPNHAKTGPEKHQALAGGGMAEHPIAPAATATMPTIATAHPPMP